MRNRLRYRYAEGEEEPAVNLTPLIDVVFSILIVFIAIAPLLELDEIVLAGVHEGGKDHGQFKDGGPISIHVRQDNTVLLNNQAVALENLAELLKIEKSRHPSARPYVYHDKRAAFGTYQTIKNAVEKAGFEEMDIVLNPI